MRLRAVVCVVLVGLGALSATVIALPQQSATCAMRDLTPLIHAIGLVQDEIEAAGDDVDAAAQSLLKLDVIVNQVQVLCFSEPPAAPAAAPDSPRPTRRPVQTNTRRPANCADALAMGLSEIEAGRWPHLDRDRDGRACYGD